MSHFSGANNENLTNDTQELRPRHRMACVQTWENHVTCLPVRFALTSVTNFVLQGYKKTKPNIILKLGKRPLHKGCRLHYDINIITDIRFCG